MDFQKLSPETAGFYRAAMGTLDAGAVPFLVGGAYAYACYTGIERHTKDLDLFIASSDLDDALKSFEDAGYTTEQTHPHWLAKVLQDDDSVDLIFASGNGVMFVDETWFSHAAKTEVLGVEAFLCPPEEMLMMKAFVMEHERYDGADVSHIIRSSGGTIDWERVLNLFGPHWRVLYSHLILFGYIYPSRRRVVPKWLTDELQRRLEREEGQPAYEEDVCRGTMLSRAQYLTDIQIEGFKDARKWPEGSMTSGQIDHWTEAIGDEL